MNILIKLMSIVSLVIAPTLASVHSDRGAAPDEVKVEQQNEAGIVVSGSVAKGSDIAVNTNAADVVTKLKNANLIVEGERAQVELKDGKLLINGKEVDNKVQMRLHLRNQPDFKLEVQ